MSASYTYHFEVIPWPGPRRSRPEYWIVKTWSDGVHTPVYGPYPTRQSAAARLTALQTGMVQA